MVVQAQNPPRPPAVNGVLAHAVSRGRRGHVMRAARSFITPSHCCSPPVCSKVETMSAEEVSADDGTGIAMEEVMKHTTSDSAWLSRAAGGPWCSVVMQRVCAGGRLRLPPKALTGRRRRAVS
jgi:hypothetical protein